MWWWFAALVALTGCDQVLGLSRGPGTSKPIEIHPSTTTALDDFTVAVVLSNDADLAAHSRGDGHDLFFTGDDGTELPSELEAFDVTTGTLAAWVRLPSLAGAPTTTTIHLHFGTDHGPPGLPADTWSTAAGAIWHFGDAGLDRALDSTPNANTLRSSDPGDPPAIVPGIVGTARAFDGTASQLAAVTSASLDGGSHAFTYTLWVNVTSSAGVDDLVLYKGGASTTDAGYDIELGTSAWSAFVRGSGGGSAAEFEFGTEASLKNRWTFLATVVDRDAGVLRGYTDGATVAADARLAQIGTISTPTPFQLSWTSHPFRGSVDEVEIYERALPAEWIVTEYDNLAHPETFLTVGAAE